eukprot:2832845-Alexandrium_andersonii.AAC.1
MGQASASTDCNVVGLAEKRTEPWLRQVSPDHWDANLLQESITMLDSVDRIACAPCFPGRTHALGCNAWRS